ncbi:unnamed protein product [Somion occarium]|uniref:DNA-directed DNA polymerase X domain-containing protein n=1 Tax=Somion occarium TaxID=3059160 RepID=A0ABP1DX36_9APHY
MFLITRRAIRSLQTPLSASRTYSKQVASPNQGLIDMLEKHKQAENDSPTRNSFKVAVFTKAISQIKAMDKRITSIGDTADLRGVGPGIKSRIASYLNGDSTDPELDTRMSLHEHQRKEAIKTLEGIRGIGKGLSKRLFAAGCRTVEQIKEPRFLKTLPVPVQVDLNFSDHWDKKATRDAAEKVAEFVGQMLPDCEVMLVGSYRRMFDALDEIDILIVHPGISQIDPPLWRTKSFLITPKIPPETEAVIEDLVDRGLLAGCVAKNLRGGWQWEGWVRLPEYKESGAMESVISRREGIENLTGEYRMMRLTVVGKKSRGAAYLTQTGDVDYYHYISDHARKLGIFLNEYGLWRWIYTDPEPSDDESPRPVFPVKDVSVGHWELVEAEDEDTILKEIAWKRHPKRQGRPPKATGDEPEAQTPKRGSKKTAEASTLGRPLYFGGLFEFGRGE